MPPRRDPVPRAREAWVWLGGTLLLGLLGAGVVAAAVLLWENVDIRQLTPGLVAAPAPLPLPEPPLAPAVEAVGFTAVLFDSPRNRAYFPDPDYHGEELDRWREILESAGATIREVGDAAGLRAAGPGEVLVLVESPCLSPAELEAIRAHVSDGGSLVANWAMGVRDGDCGWRGWDPVLDITDAEEVQELPVREGLFMTVPAGVGLSSGFDPGSRIELRPDPSLALRMTGAHVYWSDWALNPAPDEGGLGADVAAVTTTTAQGGRTAWFGLRAGQAATAVDSVHVRRLLRNGILWAAGTSSASVAAWPDGARAAMIFSLDVEDQPRNALDVAALFEAEEIPATFFTVTQLVTDDRELAEALLRAGEIGSQTADHSPLAGLTPQDQGVRLRRSWSDIERWAGVGPTGLRPPEEAFDATTLRAWREAGGEYVLTRNEGRTASPELHTTAQGPVVVLPRLLKDDYNLVVQDRTIRNERVGEAFVQGALKLHAIGGLAVVAGHTQIMQSGRRLDAFRVVANTARRQGDWWIARGDEVARWWAARSRATLEYLPAAESTPGSATEPSGLPDLLVRIEGPAPSHAVWVDVVLPRGADGIVPLVDGRSVDFRSTEWGIQVPVGLLDQGAPRRISLVRVGSEPVRNRDRSGATR